MEMMELYDSRCCCFFNWFVIYQVVLNKVLPYAWSCPWLIEHMSELVILLSM